ncbi:MAG: response regulator [Lentisphaerae bacterium]|nr:response regulator [Lentisphaerota bacterium]
MNKETYQKQDFFRVAYQGMLDALIIGTTQGELIYINPAATALTGYLPEETENLKLKQLFPDEEQPNEGTVRKEPHQTVLIGKDGTAHNSELYCSLLDLPGGPYILYVFQRITSTTEEPSWDSASTKYKSKDSTLTTELLLMHLMESSADSIYFKDRNSRIIMANKALCDRLHLTPEKLLGKTDFDWFDEVHAQQAFNDEQKIIETRTPLIGVEEKEVWTDGSMAWVSTTKMPLLNDNNEVVGTFGISRDITKWKTMEEELRETQKQAEIAAKAKSEFLANMSHEIRTPLNAIVGMGELLGDSSLTPEQRELVSVIGTSSGTLIEIVNSILDLSKIESGKLDLESVPFNLVQTIEKTVDVVVPPATTKELELMQFFKSDLPDVVIGDPTRLRQILLNLLSNAIKFTPMGGEVLIEVEGIPIDQDHCKIFVKVSDNGIGMTEQEASRVFNSFEQADTSITRKYGGTGLGLSITSRLVELMGGTLNVESKKDVGSIFSFSIVLPVFKTSVQSNSEVGLLALENRRILVVDDNATNLKILKYELEKVKMQPLLFSSGQETVNQLDSMDPVDLILLDFNMPEMFGYTLAERLRAHASTKNVPILILTSSGSPCNDPGKIINSWMNKPAKGARLRRTLADLLQQKKENEKKDGNSLFSATMAEEYPHKILLVEDNKVNQMVVRKMLAKLGYTADLAENGKEAVDAALKGSYDLILMDIQMPIMDGLEATRILRERFGEGPRPIIAGLSAHAMKENREIAIQCGMDKYITKPVRMDGLVSVLREKAH